MLSSSQDVEKYDRVGLLDALWRVAAHGSCKYFNYVSVKSIIDFVLYTTCQLD